LIKVQNQWFADRTLRIASSAPASVPAAGQSTTLKRLAIQPESSWSDEQAAALVPEQILLRPGPYPRTRPHGSLRFEHAVRTNSHSRLARPESGFDYIHISETMRPSSKADW